MHPVSRRISSLLVCTLLFLLTGCTKPKETMQLKEWLEIIVTKMNIPEASNTKPYFLHINEENPYFNIVQASVEWGILDSSVSINLEGTLTKEWAAYTLVNLIQPTEATIRIKDANKSIFPKQIATSVQLGIFEVDQRNCFNPKQSLSREDALEKFELVKDYVNNYKVSEPRNELEFSDDLIDVDVPLEFNEDDLKAVLSDKEVVKEGDVIRWFDHQDQFFKVVEVQESENGIEVQLVQPEYQDIFEKFEIEDSSHIDFSNAEIEMLNENIKEVGTTKIQQLISKEIKIKDFEGSIDAGVNGITLKLRKGDIKTEAKIYQVKPTVRWKTSNQGIEDAYFKLNFNTTELIKLEPTINKNYYSDFSNLKGDNFVQSLLASFKTSEDLNGTTIPICEIKVPFPNLPILQLTMQLKFHVYASGKIELVLVNEHQLGIEIKNDKMRIIQDSKRNADFIVKASASSTLGLTTGVSAGNLALMDIQIKAGIRGYMDTIVHLYDSKGEKSELKVDVPLDKADTASLNHDDVKVCGNLNLHWVLDVGFNTSKTIASKIGFSKTLNVINENNGKIILNKKTHIENWQFLEKCTRGKRKVKETNQPIQSDKIILEKINLVIYVDESKKINIVGLPNNVDESDLIYSSNQIDVAKVNQAGVVTGVKRGSAIITIKSSDGNYFTHCNILVSEKRTNDLHNI